MYEVRCPSARTKHPRLAFPAKPRNVLPSRMEDAGSAVFCLVVKGFIAGLRRAGGLEGPRVWPNPGLSATDSQAIPRATPKAQPLNPHDGDRPRTIEPLRRPRAWCPQAEPREQGLHPERCCLRASRPRSRSRFSRNRASGLRRSAICPAARSSASICARISASFAVAPRE